MGLTQRLVYGAAKRWIAGKDMEAALLNAKKANAEGLGTILNFLGEDITDSKVTGAHFEEYQRLQRAISESHVDGCVSVKLTQLGLGGGDESVPLERANRLAEAAASMKQMLWIDMESSAFTSKTIELYSRILNKHENVGVALQAYLRRSEADLQKLMEIGGKVRLVKGAYREPPDLVFPTRALVTENYLKLMSVLFEKGQGFAVATHDTRPIDEAKRLHESHPGVKFEFEMLRGIRDPLKLELAKSGYRVVDYLPYGVDWYGYSMRRIKEHPSNILLLIRSL